MEANTFACSVYIDVPPLEAANFLRNGDNLGAFALDTAMAERVDDVTWRGSVGPYQDGFYCQSRYQDVVDVQVVEWFCGSEHGRWNHFYPMVLFPAGYFGSQQAGVYCHWISFVDPARSAPILELLPSVRRGERHSLKAALERRAGHHEPVESTIELRSHTLYVDAPAASVVSYLAARSNLTEWSFPSHHDDQESRDEYGRPISVRIGVRDLQDYHLVEHETRIVETGQTVRAPFLVIPTSFAFGQPDATGVVLHRVTAAEIGSGRRTGDLYDAELVRTKRFLEAGVGNGASFAHGPSYRPVN
ncbi:hypothetical protein [Kribbella ginsengisoli]|uniref:Uncharacterized protein n=1 Tax=Kribbella ginsengisoli TaxID=363865 RepID=A0ABP6Z8R9_9ACTN